MSASSNSRREGISEPRERLRSSAGYGVSWHENDDAVWYVTDDKTARPR